MKKILLCGLLSLCLAPLTAQEVGLNLRSFVNSQGKATSIIPKKYSIQRFDDKDFLSVIIKAADVDNVKTKLRSMGCKVTSGAGKILVAFVPVAQVENVLSIKGIEAIDAARKVGAPNLKKATQDINADYVHSGMELPQGYTGKGVIIGDCDWGTDYTHPTFYDTSMNEYRILAAWDQFRTAVNDTIYGYGEFLTTKEALLAAQTDTANIYDYGSHATHVGGIMGGGGAGTQYRGIAYGADLLFATWKVSEADVLNAYSWMRDVAKAEGKRLVINNSWGIYHFGSMDGGSLFDEFVEQMSRQDSVVFTASAGNNGDVAFHLAAKCENNDTVSSEFQFNFPTPYADNYWGETITLAADSVADFSVQIVLYDNAWQKIHESQWLSTNAEAGIDDFIFVTNEGDSLIYNAITGYSHSGRAIQEWNVRLSKYVQGYYHAVVSITAADGWVHAWNLACLSTGVGNWGLPFVASLPGFAAGDVQYGIGEPAIGDGMISVASYSAGIRNSLSTPSNISNFSSRGPNLNGIRKPEIAAPGQGVVSSYSSFATETASSTTSVDFNGRTYTFSSMSGTSMSCPMVSGVIALMLEANPHLTSEQVREILLQTARQDNYTGHSLPDYTWGYGKVDALAAVKEAVNKVSMSSVEQMANVKVYPNPTTGVVNIATDIPIKSIIVSDVTGRQLMEIKSSNSVDLSGLATGIYYLNIRFSAFNLVKKVIKR
ncbi:MAG: S8 family peptidase [Bacteroidales bacterium]|jgi:subtilisin family serine protease|nr:S8 family peptidase [Bacteroidales bacterium]